MDTKIARIFYNASGITSQVDPLNKDSQIAVE